MDQVFPVTHSTLSVEALKTNVLTDYDLEDVIDLKLLNLGLNDTYVVRTVNNRKYILRVYRKGWRSNSDILYEIDVLNHLSNKDVSVSKPLSKKDGEFIKVLLAPEGKRSAVLFTYAEGKEAPYEKDVKTKMFNYGRGAAKIHQATEDFKSQHSRFLLDIDYLINTPLKSIGSMLSHRQKDWNYLLQLADKIHTQLSKIPIDNLEQGFCHGDLHSGNANFADDETVTFYDFDSGGWGYRAYDISVLRWNARLRKKERKFWKPFLRGYQKERSLKNLDLQAVPLFVGIRHFLLLGVHTAGGKDWGYGWMNDQYFTRAIEFFKKWEKEYLD